MVIVDYPAMGARIRKYRKSKGITQQELATAVDLSCVTISHIECGTGKPELNTLVKIVNQLDVSVDMVLSDSLSGGHTVHFAELDGILAGCSGNEIRMICEVTRSLLAAYRSDKSLKGNMNA